jgi:hypothetical protein
MRYRVWLNGALEPAVAQLLRDEPDSVLAAFSDRLEEIRRARRAGKVVVFGPEWEVLLGPPSAPGPEIVKEETDDADPQP